MKESVWLNRVIALAEQFQWKVWHVAAPMRSDGKGGFVGDSRAAGLCDLILLHDDPPRMVLAELKGTGGKLSDAQREFLQAARDVADSMPANCCGERFDAHLGVYVWTPEDEPMVEALLRTRRLS